MKTRFSGKKISGILTILPQSKIPFEDEISNYSFPEAQTLRLKTIMGYKQHRVAKSESASSDMCVHGLRYLIDSGKLAMEDIGALVVLTVTPDYLLPHVSNIIHGKCDLPEEVFCLDISQGCCAFLTGLFEAFMLLEHMKDKKVILFNTDVLSHKVSRRDRNSYPLIGDAATITVVENDLQSGDIHFMMENDGKQCDVLRIPAGGSRLPSNAETAQMKDDGEGNFRALDNLCMDGSEVFTFVQTRVPPLIHETLQYAEQDIADIDWFIFHQPNRFMLQKLADRIGAPRDKVLMNVVENYGNPSGASIPLAITHNLSEQMLHGSAMCCLSAFGSGLTWGAITMRLGDMKFCEMLQSDF